MNKTLSRKTLLQQDGTEIVIRPVCNEDALRLLDMHNRLSSDSIYYRYLRCFKPTLHDLRQIERIHGCKGTVLVASLKSAQEMVIGMDYYVHESGENDAGLDKPTTAEWAILVEDAYQGQGLGRLLLQCLIQVAIAMKVQILHAETHPENRKVMRLIRSTNLSLKCTQVYGVRKVDIQLIS